MKVPFLAVCAVGVVGLTFSLTAAARPICGIIPTTTSCWVEIDGTVISAVAHDCDSPVPSLIKQLHAAGVEDTKGLTATCVREQMDLGEEYTISL